MKSPDPQLRPLVPLAVVRFSGHPPRIARRRRKNRLNGHHVRATRARQQLLAIPNKRVLVLSLGHPSAKLYA
jgi:hypothetical protein